MDDETTDTPRNDATLWRVRLFEGPILEDSSEREIQRFRSAKIGALLAYLALRLGRSCPREELYAALWPEEADAKIVANRLRVALASLRRQLEPQGIPFGSVLDVSLPGRVALRSETVWCDAVAFEKAFKAGRKAEAARLLMGTLLPGYYDDWAIRERERYETLLDELTLTDISGRGTASESFPLPVQAPNSKLQTPPNSLPLYLTRYFGREEEKRQLADALCAHRLTTLTGPGGMGKTRLAVETVRKLPLPAVFVPLADVAEGRGVPEAVLRSLRVTPSVEYGLIEQIIAVLSRRESSLLILDNAEHLTEEIAPLTLRLLEAVPDLTILVTSRQRLNIAGEVVLPLLPLTPPAPETSPESLAEQPAVALFIDRAQNVRPDFRLTERHSDAMRRICHHLEGSPLALELAAARIVMQTPTQIADSLKSGLMRLSSQQHGFSPRHRSLGAAIQGSFDSLTSGLQAFFVGLSLFRCGWTLEAAGRVTESEQAEAMLEALALRSLIVTQEDETTGNIRYSFLESVRQFAAEQLNEAERDALTMRHADCYLSLAAAVRDHDVETFRPLDSEQENLLSALETGVKSENALYRAALIGALTYGHFRGKHRVFLPWAERALTLLESVPGVAESVRTNVTISVMIVPLLERIYPILIQTACHPLPITTQNAL